MFNTGRRKSTVSIEFSTFSLKEGRWDHFLGPLGRSEFMSSKILLYNKNDIIKDKGTTNGTDLKLGMVRKQL